MLRVNSMGCFKCCIADLSLWTLVCTKSRQTPREECPWAIIASCLLRAGKEDILYVFVQLDTIHVRTTEKIKTH